MIAEDADLTPDPYLDPGRIILSVKKQFLKNIARFLFMWNSDPEADHIEAVHDLLTSGLLLILESFEPKTEPKFVIPRLPKFKKKKFTCHIYPKITEIFPKFFNKGPENKKFFWPHFFLRQ